MPGTCTPRLRVSLKMPQQASTGLWSHGIAQEPERSSSKSLLSFD